MSDIELELNWRVSNNVAFLSVKIYIFPMVFIRLKCIFAQYKN